MVEIGFMQGRFSPLVQGKIQAFPWEHWQNEFALAQSHGFHRMEWTLDAEGLQDNPLMTMAGRITIQELCDRHRLQIRSLTGDCLMNEPFWKELDTLRETRLTTLKAIIEAAGDLGIQFIVMPLVDQGSLESNAQRDNLLAGLKEVQPILERHHIKIVFESDFPPAQVREFIAQLSPEYFGINYDSGNSAALDYDPEEEFQAYGKRIDNIHIKDRLLRGTTVPLGTGNADLPKVCALIKDIGYQGQLILQTARAKNGNHAEVLCHYRALVQTWLA